MGWWKSCFENCPITIKNYSQHKEEQERESWNSLRQRQTERETDRETDRQREREGE